MSPSTKEHGVLAGTMPERTVGIGNVVFALERRRDALVARRRRALVVGVVVLVALTAVSLACVTRLAEFVRRPASLFNQIENVVVENAPEWGRALGKRLSVQAPRRSKVMARRTLATLNANSRQLDEAFASMSRRAAEALAGREQEIAAAAGLGEDREVSKMLGSIGAPEVDERIVARIAEMVRGEVAVRLRDLGDNPFDLFRGLHGELRALAQPDELGFEAAAARLAVSAAVAGMSQGSGEPKVSSGDDDAEE